MLFHIKSRQIGIIACSSVLPRKVPGCFQSAPHIGGMVRFTSFIVKTTVLIELIGAALLFRIISVQANNKQESAVIMENL